MTQEKQHSQKKPVIIITGSAGNIGSSLLDQLESNYTVVGFDQPGTECHIEIDITSNESVELAFIKFKEKYGSQIAAVIHLAAYFDFSGEESPLYKSINEDGTERLLEHLQNYSVERFIYVSTMLVHQPVRPGDWINENSPVQPKWAYPKSKADTEKIIQQHHGDIPFAILRLAGLYDEQIAIPTLANQIANIYERDFKSNLYSGDIHAGQSLIHREDFLALLLSVIEHRQHLENEFYLLAGEPDVLSYAELQHLIGKLIHGEERWKTISVPKPLATAGAWIEEHMEPVIPDDFDSGEKPFIRPFMMELSSDHYALDISRAKESLDWYPKHSIQTDLAKNIESLKKNPLQWYQNNGINPPAWMENAGDKNKNPERLLQDHESSYRKQHYQNIWANFFNIGLGFWLFSSPFSMGYQSEALIINDIVCGFLVIIFGSRSLSPHPRKRNSRWMLGAIGLWLTMAPLVFWAPTPAAYLNDTLIGALIIAFSMLVRPTPGLSPIATQSGPDIPPGWEFSPSDWFQRIPIIVLAFIGFYISRYLTAYQLGHIDSVWDPFFSGTESEPIKNGTEEIITSSVSKAWPVPDAGLGALTYLLEILTGIMGSRARWRTMPWLVLIFGFMIIPLGVVSITFIIIQPIILDTWCTLCLLAATAMLLQIPYSFDEIVATIQFLSRRAKAGKPWLLIVFTGDTEEGERKKPIGDNFAQNKSKMLSEMLAGGVSAPWTLCLCAITGIWLMSTRLILGTDGTMANADHLIGALVLTISITAFAEVMRSVRFLNIFLGMALFITPFVLTDNILSIVSSLIAGALLVLLSFPRGKIYSSYGNWNKLII